MKNIFIELTAKDDSKIFLNVMTIAWVEPDKSGSVIKSNMVHYSISTKVKESYEDVKSKIASLNSQ
jgi:hypothetical protein